MTNITFITDTILAKMPKISKPQHRFILHIFTLIVSIRSRLNYLMMARFGQYGEQSYRNWFAKGFDFASFNKSLIKEYCGSSRIILFDPSFLSKSGKATPGTGYFWSGCANQVKWGMELSCLAIGDVENHTALHFHAGRTQPSTKGKGHQKPLEFYTNFILERAKGLLEISKILCTDAYFAKAPFIGPMKKAGFTLVGRLQHNIFLRYRYKGAQKSKGRRKLFAGKVDIYNPDGQHFQLLKQAEGLTVYEGVAHVRCLKDWFKLIIVHTHQEGKPLRVQVFYSTDCEMSGLELMDYYQLRFQIEFLFRDAKNHLGLQDTQSRTAEALDFHYNASLTALNLAKIAHWYTQPKEERKPFSMYDIKVRYSNQLLLDQLILIYGKDPEIEKNNPEIRHLYNFGAIAA